MTTTAKSQDALQAMALKAVNRPHSWRKWNGNKLVYEPYVSVDDAFIMDWTGWMDYEAQAIYEGDIVTVRVGEPVPHNTLYIVMMYEGGWFAVNEREEYYFPLYQKNAEWEIMGNVFENPDMLEEIF